jgi:MoxR-like ATPase
MASWLDLDGDGSLHFRVSGPPGVGKNELVYYLAREVERKPLYIMHGHEELTPEDIACTARITQDNRVEYVGSPLLAAMVRGGICFFDEIGKVPSRSLSLLASVLDDRRTLTSVLAGFSVKAHPGFRFCAAMNDADAATYGLPGYIDERLRPAFKIDYPPLEEIMTIVNNGVSAATSILLEQFRLWAVSRDTLSPREALTLVSYACRLHHRRGGGDLTAAAADALIAEAAEFVGEGKIA